MHHLLRQLRSFAVLRKQSDLVPLVTAGFQHLDAAHPSGLFTVVDLSEIQDLALHHSLLGTPTSLDDAPVTMELPVFDSLRAAQEHVAIVHSPGCLLYTSPSPRD